MATSKTLKTCVNGHQFYKSSSCPICPICEKELKHKTNFLTTLSAPARRAMERLGITCLADLTKYSEADILKLHGVGPSSTPIIKAFLASENLCLKED